MLTLVYDKTHFIILMYIPNINKQARVQFHMYADSGLTHKNTYVFLFNITGLITKLKLQY